MAPCVPALLVTGADILAHHPRLHRGETGFFGDPALLSFGSTKASRGWGFALGEARSIHFAAAGLLHLAAGAANGHLRRDLWPARRGLGRPLLRSLADHARLQLRSGEAAEGYDVLQKLA